MVSVNATYQKMEEEFVADGARAPEIDTFYSDLLWPTLHSLSVWLTKVAVCRGMVKKTTRFTEIFEIRSVELMKPFGRHIELGLFYGCPVPLRAMILLLQLIGQQN